MTTSAGTCAAYLFAAASSLAVCAGCSASTTAPAAAPSVAFAASESDVASACELSGVPEVVASHVSPMAGVAAEADGSRVWIRFATRSDPRAALAIDPSSLEVADQEGAAPEGLSPIAAGVKTQRPLEGPVAVRIEGGRSLVAWTEGSTEDGMRVSAVTLAGGGAVVGTPIDLGYEGSAIGRPAVAVTAAGRGVLAFEESYGGGFHLVVTRVVCSPAGNR